jgi:hypothetical protein
MTMPIASMSVKQLRRAVRIKQRIETLETKLANILGSSNQSPADGGPNPKRKMSASARRKIAAAKKARWAKFKAAKAGK